MGKGFRNNKINMIAAIFLSAMLFIVSNVSSSNAYLREFELFDQGYEYFLSDQPKKAVETFSIFLKEFPDSSAKDAAMLWLGKSLIHLKSFGEAKKVLSEIKQQFPDSPFIPYAGRELEMISRTESGANKTEAGLNVALKEKKAFEGRLSEIQKELEIKESDLIKAIEDRDKLRAQLEEEKKKTEGMKTELAKHEGREAELKGLAGKYEEQQNDRKKFDDYVKQIKDERDQFESEIQRLKKEEVLKENEREKLKDKLKRYEIITINIKDKKFIASEIFECIVNSSVVMTKLGVKEALWKTGNIYEDFVNEQILHDEAKRLNVNGDMKKHKELVERYNLKREEADYLYKYLTISALIDRKVKNMPGEKVAESLLVRYTESDEYEKAVLAAEIQKDAKSGKSFEDICKSYLDAVKFAVIDFHELQGWIKERIQSLKDGEISDVVRTEYDYIILKPVVKKLSYSPFEAMQPGVRDKIRILVKGWIDELRMGAKEIEIELAE